MSDIVARLHAMIDANYGDVAADSVYGSAMSDAADEITRLRYENASLASWQCEFTDGKTGLVYAEGGGTYCAMAKEVARLRAALRDIHAAAGNNHLIANIARAALGEKP